MTDAGLITCPKCTNEFAITAAMTDSIASELRAEFAAAQQAEQAKLAAERRKVAEDLRLIQNEKAALAEAIQKGIEQGKKEIVDREARKAAESVKAVIEQLNAQLTDSRSRLELSQKAELDLRQKQEQVEQQKKEMDLQLARAKDEARSLASKQKDDEFRLKEADHQRQMEQVKKQLDEALRKAEQGSQQHQGETFELDIEIELRKAFPADELLEVKKGERGADLKQVVRSDLQQDCGVIQWEFKRAKAWNDGWVDKARSDRMACKAHAAIIVSTTAPRDCAGLARVREVWVVSPQLLVPLAMAIRQSLIGAAQLRRSYEGKHHKMSELYDYMMGEEFGSRIKLIVDTFAEMKRQIDAERKVFEKQWAEREKLIERVCKSTTALAGHISAIGGRDLSAIECLSLKALETVES